MSAFKATGIWPKSSSAVNSRGAIKSFRGSKKKVLNSAFFLHYEATWHVTIFSDWNTMSKKSRFLHKINTFLSIWISSYIFFVIHLRNITFYFVKKNLQIDFILYFCTVDWKKSALKKTINLWGVRCGQRRGLLHPLDVHEQRVKRESRANRELTRNCEVHKKE